VFRLVGSGLIDFSVLAFWRWLLSVFFHVFPLFFLFPSIIISRFFISPLASFPFLRLATLPFVLISLLIPRSPFSPSADPSTWSIEQAKTWLETHKIHVPTTTDDILAAVRDNFDLVARKGAQAVGAGQAYYEVYSDKAVDSWSESQLREFLLEQGVVSPKGTVEELRIAAKQR